MFLNGERCCSPECCASHNLTRCDLTQCFFVQTHIFFVVRVKFPDLMISKVRSSKFRALSSDGTKIFSSYIALASAKHYTSDPTVKDLNCGHANVKPNAMRVNHGSLVFSILRLGM